MKASGEKIIQLVISSLDQTFFFQFNHEQIHTLKPPYPVADLILKATPMGLIKFCLSGHATPGAGITFSGDLETARAFQKLVETLKINGQTLLTSLLGEDFGSHFYAFTQILQEQVLQPVFENKTLFPNKTELTTFLDQVDLLRANVERIEAKVTLYTSIETKG